MMAKMGMAMPMPPWTAADVWFTFAMWAVMMVGMMTPGASPVLLLFAGAKSKRGTGRVAVPVFMFGSGYLLVWGAFSACAALAQWLLHQQAMLSPMMAASSPRVAGAILVGAGLYQFTRFKHACLSHCQSPLGFLMTHWHNGLTGAFRMGLEHGVYCLGCCWALMLVLLVVGLMNLAWMAGLFALIYVEKTWRHGLALAKVAGGALVAVGIAVAAHPALLELVSR